MKVIKGDITTLKVDAIVNAANNSLLGGGGVDGAIHKAAGPELLIYNRQLNGCATGDAKISPGFNLPAKYIIHTVGPVYIGQEIDDYLLERCYLASLLLAQKHQLKSIAFPNISTGVYNFPAKEAAEIAVRTCSSWLALYDSDIELTFCCYTQENYEAIQEALTRL